MLEAKKDVAADVLDSFDFAGVTDTAIEEASKEESFKFSGSVKMDPNDEFLEFKNDDLLKKLKVFVQKKAASRDIITKSLRIVVESNQFDKVTLMATDGVSYLWARVGATINKFPLDTIIDNESFFIVAKTHSGKSFLIHREGKVYSDFYGGEIFIPSYRIKSDVFCKEPEKKTREEVVDAVILRDALQSLSPVLTSSEVPELGYVFVEEEGVFSSNGILIARVKEKLPQFIIRQSDLNLLILMLDSIQNEKLTLTEFDKFYRLSSENFMYTFPKVAAKLVQQYKDAVNTESKVKYFVNLPYFRSILNVFTQMPDDSGVLEVEFGDELRGVSKTKKGEESVFVITPSKEGTVSDKSAPTKFGVSNKSLIVAMRVFGGESAASFSYEEGKLIVSSEKKECVILLKR